MPRILSWEMYWLARQKTERAKNYEVIGPLQSSFYGEQAVGSGIIRSCTIY
jgi:hypothetical protein